jgi:hypothetical protein
MRIIEKEFRSSSSAGEAEKRRRNGWHLSVEGIDKSSARVAVTRGPEAEEFPLLKTVARECG